MAAARKGAKGGALRVVFAVGVLLLVGILVGSAISQWRGVPVVPLPQSVHARGASGRVRVEVLNGGGYAGAARAATETLRDLGFDVVFFGNAGTSDRDSSVVLDRIGALDRARDVADALRIRNLRSEPDSNLYLDVTVVLGRDWQPATPVEVVPEPVQRRPWWDPRGWLGH
jgi:hypothetical protein